MIYIIINFIYVNNIIYYYIKVYILHTYIIINLIKYILIISYIYYSNITNYKIITINDVF